MFVEYFMGDRCTSGLVMHLEAQRPVVRYIHRLRHLECRVVRRCGMCRRERPAFYRCRPRCGRKRPRVDGDVQSPEHSDQECKGERYDEEAEDECPQRPLFVEVLDLGNRGSRYGHGVSFLETGLYVRRCAYLSTMRIYHNNINLSSIT